MTKSVIQGLQVCRGLAALAVVAHHAAVATDAFVEDVPNAWLEFFDLGALGVDFFFVLSGFIIMHAHMHDVGNIRTIRPYFYKRLTRIFPAYWPIGIALVALYAALPGLSASGGREYSYLSSVLLLPADLPPALSVAWTLVHELMFYALFMLWFISRRVFWIGLTVWLLTIIISQTSGSTAGWLRYPFSLLNIEFIFGVLTALAYGKARLLKFTGTMIAGGGLLACFVLLLLYQDNLPTAIRLFFALGLSVMLLGLANRERQRQFAWPTCLLTLGNASYSIYLVHNPLLSLTQRVAGRLGFSWPLGLLAGIFLGVLLGYLYFRWVERPALQLFRSFQPMKINLVKTTI